MGFRRLHTGAVSGFVYGGRALEARRRCWWKVQVWDGGGRDCGWSEPAYWEMGLFPEDWEASWIGQGDGWEGDPSAAPLFACDFESPLGEMDHARLYVSGLGLFCASLNGAPLADTLFDPGECDATRSVYYVTYDVTSLLREGAQHDRHCAWQRPIHEFPVQPRHAQPAGRRAAPAAPLPEG